MQEIGGNVSWTAPPVEDGPRCCRYRGQGARYLGCLSEAKLPFVFVCVSWMSAYDVDFNRLQRSQDRPFWLRDFYFKPKPFRPLWKRQVWTASRRGGWGGMILQFVQCSSMNKVRSDAASYGTGRCFSSRPYHKTWSRVRPVEASRTSPSPKLTWHLLMGFSC